MNRLKTISIWSQLPVAFSMSFTLSAVMLVTMQSVSDTMLNISELIGLGISVLVYKALERKGMRDKLVAHGRVLMLVQGFIFVCIAMISYHWLEWRYFAISVIWGGVIDFTDAVFETRRNLLITKDELSVFSIQKKKMARVGQILGMLSILLYIQHTDATLDLGVALTIQVIGALISCVVTSMWFTTTPTEVIADTKHPLGITK